MSWKKVVEEPLVTEYFNTLTKELAYKNETKENVISLINNGVEVWYYKNDSIYDDYFNICLAIRINKDNAKIVTGVPVGAITGTESAKLIISKIREILDQYKIEDFYAKILPIDHYSLIEFQDFIRSIPKVMWECETPNDLCNLKLRRDPTRKHEDQSYVGPLG